MKSRIDSFIERLEEGRPISFAGHHGGHTAGNDELQVGDTDEAEEGAKVLAAKPHQIAAHLKPDNLTVAVVMNHHYETDRDGLAALLPLGLPYIAVLGPRRRTDRILKQLEVHGVTVSEEMLASLHAPAGLDLGAETPEQIALAILAEIQASLAGRDGSMLKYRLVPIHVESPPTEVTPCVASV